MSLEIFHPLLRTWFGEHFRAPTEPQCLGWPAIAAGQDTLIAAPTGSGKTLAAFLASLDRLLKLALAGELKDQTYVVYVSPLRALANDIQRNLQTPLAELMALVEKERIVCPEIRALVRTGDTPASERQRMLRQPPHILVTTPESLYLLLTGRRSREILRNVETVIVDEIHALARDKRGSHLALSLERLEALCDMRPVRIGLSATQKPLDEIGRFLVGSSHRGLNTPRSPILIDVGHMRELDLAVEVPERELEAVCSHEHWGEIYERLVTLIKEHRSTLIFVNTRRMAERITHQLSERLGLEHVSSHHGSLAHRMRHSTEQRLKSGDLKAVVATASLELGIDIGHIDLVCQIGTPRSIATFLQRVGRAGHSLGVVPKGRLFALTREELIECLALVRAVYAGRLDHVEIPKAPLDILAQQIVAAVACDEWDEDALLEVCRRAYPYRDLDRDDYNEVLEMLSEGIARQHGRRGAYLHRDQINRKLRARRGARMIAITCGGAIPEIADYRVVTDSEERTFVGTVDEDFAVESMAGDIFLLGNTSWQVRHVRGGEVVVRDAKGAPPTIPFWRGEAPGRTFELSTEVAQLREELAGRLKNGVTVCHGLPASMDSAGLAETVEAGNPCHVSATSWLERECHVSFHGAVQAAHYVAAQLAAVGMMPTQERILFERFFDESGGMQLVIHAPFGTRINRAWGLALRKRFCRSFDFELQAAAGDNGIVLSLGAQHSFPLEQMFRLVPSAVARDILVQAMLAVPFFTTRWRWNVTRSLIMRRWQNGHRVPPFLQRMRTDDLLSAVFPAQTACQENVTGDIEVPDHPLVNQTVHDCLYEACNLDGWLAVLKDIESGKIELVGLDTREPSPFSHELLNAQPYAFLDDAPLEERRARAVSLRRTLPMESLRDLGRLDPAAIAQVCADAWPTVRDADELHDVLLSMGVVLQQEAHDWQPFFEELVATGRAVVVRRLDGSSIWAATERWPLVRVLWPGASAASEPVVPASIRTDWNPEAAATTVLRGRLECTGPATAARLADDLQLPLADVQRALAGLELEGTILRGRFTGDAAPPLLSSNGRNGVMNSDDDAGLEWCDRRLLARIHRLTLDGLRRQIQPVEPARFLHFLARQQHTAAHSPYRGPEGLLALIGQLQGFEAPAGDWDRHILPCRMAAYDPKWLDTLTVSGQVVWGRLRSVRRPAERARPMKALTRNVPITLMRREDLAWLLPEDQQARAGSATTANGQRTTDALFPDPYATTVATLSGNAQAVYEILSRHGALFIDQLARLLKTVDAQVSDALGELAAAGLVTSDNFAALRNLAGLHSDRMPAAGHLKRRLRSRRLTGPLQGGRWSLLRGFWLTETRPEERIENWTRLLLHRYGLMFRDLLAREPAAPPWRDLVCTYRRLEARGEIRGGRFVAAVAGEQFALPEVIEKLRGLERDPPDAKPLVLAATDPLNLFGRALPGLKVPATARNRIALRNGQLVACRIAGEVRQLEAATTASQAAIHSA